MKYKIILCLLLSTILLSSCSVVSNNSKNMYTRASAISKISSIHTVAKVNLGSIAYVKSIERIAKISGNRLALSRVMSDVNKYGYELDSNSYQYNLAFYKLVSNLIYKIGYVDKDSHFFRNKLNRAPNRLEDLFRLNASLPIRRRWRLLPARNSLFHMQGKDGCYNLKFESSDSFCEAVYNKNGVLLTEKNDPINMGTFNYGAGIPGNKAHQKYDIDPYLKWGNTADSPQKNQIQIMNGVNLARREYIKNVVQVISYRMKIINEMSNYKKTTVLT